jgi:hypothetical protein
MRSKRTVAAPAGATAPPQEKPMRWVTGILIVVVLGVLGFAWLRPEIARPVAERVVQPLAPTASRPAGTTSPGPAAGDQAATSDRTKALTDEVANRAQQVAADAARRMQATAERVANAAQDVAKAGAGLEIGDTDVGRQLTQAVDEVTATLGGITDRTSAEAAVPKLAEIDGRLSQLKPKIAQLPENAKKTLASLVTGMLPKIKSAVDRVQTTPGAAEVVKPALDPIVTRLDAWSEKPA